MSLHRSKIVIGSGGDDSPGPNIDPYFDPQNAPETLGNIAHGALEWLGSRHDEASKFHNNFSIQKIGTDPATKMPLFRTTAASYVAEVTTTFTAGTADNGGYDIVKSRDVQLNRSAIDEIVVKVTNGKASGLSTLIKAIHTNIKRDDKESLKTLDDIETLSKKWTFQYDKWGGIDKMSIDGKNMSKDDPLWALGKDISDIIYRRSDDIHFPHMKGKILYHMYKNIASDDGDKPKTAVRTTQHPKV